MHAAIAEKRDEIARVCRRYGVLRLDVFGSAARGTDFDPESSDADFLVKFSRDSGLGPLEQFFGFAEELHRILGRSVDLVESGGVKNPYLCASINRSREVVFTA